MKFSYKALNKKDSLVEGVIEASSKESAIASINKFGYKPISLKAVKEANGGFKFSQKVKSDDLVIFTRQLSAMVSAGVPLLRSLNSLAGDEKNPIQKKIKLIMKSVEGGSTFSEALDQHPDVFDKIYVNMVKAGEAAGILDDILKRLALQQEKASSMKKKIKSAMAYPTALMVIIFFSFFGLMLFVIPKLGEIIKNMSGDNAKLPMITEVMLAISNFFLSWWYVIFPVMFGGAYLLRKWLKTEKGKAKADSIILKIPKVNTIIMKIVVSRFTRTFSALMGAGVSVVQALEVSSDAIGNKVYSDSLARASEGVKNGRQLSEMIAKEPKIWPEIVSQMLAVGEETGNTDTVLIKVAEFYEEEVDLEIEKINSIIEPVMIVIMGAVVGLIAASVMSPIAGLSKNIQS